MTWLARIPPITEVVLPIVNIEKAWYSPRHAYHPPCYDRNLETYGDTDLGEPLQSPYAGFIEFVGDLGGGWGKCIRIIGYEITKWGVKWFAWLGAHWNEIYVQIGQIVKAGTLLGTLGKTGLAPSHGAHLHEQISSGFLPPVTLLGGTSGFHWIDCNEFYQKHGIDAKILAAISLHDGK